MILTVLDGTKPPPTVEVSGIRKGAGPAAVTAVARSRGMKGYAIKHWHYGMAWVPDVPVLPETAEEAEDEQDDGRPQHEIGGG